MDSLGPTRGAAGANSASGSAGRVLAVVPARLASTRLPRKMMLRESGQYLFEHTARAVLASGAAARVVVATDSSEILEAARAVGLDALLTSDRHKSGTDRVHEAWRTLAREQAFDLVINVQGDEPELDASALPGLAALFADPAVELASLWAPLDSPALFADPNCVKVVCDAAGWALYFSRAPIPSRAHPGSRAAGGAEAVKLHLGVYAFRPAALERFCALPPSDLEAAESLEQLRWLDDGGRIRMLRAAHASRGIDTPEDYRAFLERARSRVAPHATGRAG